MPGGESRKEARRGLTLFFTLLILLTIPAWWLRIAHITSMAILFPPAVASILTRLIRREGFGDVSFRLRGRNLRKAYLVAWLFPMIAALIAYGFTWITGLTRFDFSGIRSSASIPLPEPTLLAFPAWLLLSWTLVTALSMVLAAGEEIGWRGYMLTRLVDSGVPRPLLIHGLIWAAYHIPLIAGGAYAHAAGPSVVLSVGLFTIVATSYSYLLAWLRLDTGILWPCLVAHAAWNALSQSAFNPVTRGDDAMLWIGESGIVSAVVLILMLLLVSRMYRSVREVP